MGLCSSVVERAPAGTITSGRWGCGAFTDGGEWFQRFWPVEWECVHIAVKELLPIVVACAVWELRSPSAQISVGWAQNQKIVQIMHCVDDVIPTHDPQ